MLKKTHDKGITLGLDDEIILGKNDLPVGKILYNTIYLKYMIYYF